MEEPDHNAARPADRISLEKIRQLMGAVLPPPPLWLLVIGVAVALSTIHVAKSGSGRWTVDFNVTGVTVVLVSFVWLPALVRLFVIAGGALKTPAGEASTPGLAGLLGSIDPDRNILPEYVPPWARAVEAGLPPAIPDVTQPTPIDWFSSLAPELVRLIQDPVAADYAVVDLGRGNKWLTSRLFLFAEIFVRMRGLRCFVFVYTDERVSRRFIGTAAPRQVRWTLASQYPWLEEAFAAAYADLPRYDIRSAEGALDLEEASALITGFLARVQRSEPPEVRELSAWVRVGGANTWEHAAWLEADLPASLRATLNRASALDGTESEITRVVLTHSGAPFVAVLGPSGEFLRLVDREGVLEQVAVRLSQEGQLMDLRRSN